MSVALIQAYMPYVQGGINYTFDVSSMSIFDYTHGVSLGVCTSVDIDTSQAMTRCYRASAGVMTPYKHLNSISQSDDQNNGHPNTTADDLSNDALYNLSTCYLICNVGVTPYTPINPFRAYYKPAIWPPNISIIRLQVDLNTTLTGLKEICQSGSINKYSVNKPTTVYDFGSFRGYSPKAIGNFGITLNTPYDLAWKASGAALMTTSKLPVLDSDVSNNIARIESRIRGISANLVDFTSISFSQFSTSIINTQSTTQSVTQTYYADVYYKDTSNNYTLITTQSFQVILLGKPYSLVINSIVVTNANTLTIKYTATGAGTYTLNFLAQDINNTTLLPDGPPATNNGNTMIFGSQQTVIITSHNGHKFSSGFAGNVTVLSGFTTVESDNFIF
jgi:hypothetical protein